MKKYLSFLCAVFFLSTYFCFAQSVSSIADCPYQFTKDESYGQTDKDVLVIQEILNSDVRTKVADTGVGSPGNETTYFGQATRTALKRFQALFIEFIGTADGKFTEKTMNVMQTICNGGTVGDTSGNSQVPSSPTTDTPPPQPTGPLIIQLTPNVNSISTGDTLKMVVDFNKEVTSFTPDSLIIEGGTVKEIRKLSKQKSLVLITPNDDANKIDIQIEAEKVTAADTSVNDNASNEVVVTINTTATTSDSNAFSSIQSKLNDLLTNIGFGGATTSTASTQNCYGNTIPITSTCTDPNAAAQQAQQPAGSDPSSMLMQMLPGLMSGLGGGGAGGSGSQGSGNSGSGNSGTGNGGSPYGKTNTDPDGKDQPPKTGDTNKCSKDVASDAEFRGLLKSSGIDIAGGQFNGELKDGAIMLKQLQTDCGCKLTITSGIRAGRASGTAHGPNTRSFDVKYSTELLSMLKSKGSGGQCWYTYKGIRFLDEKVCPSKQATGPHWHIEGNGWQCSQ